MGQSIPVFGLEFPGVSSVIYHLQYEGIFFIHGWFWKLGLTGSIYAPQVSNGDHFHEGYDLLLFVVLTLGVINAIMTTSNGEIAGVNALILIAVFATDGNRMIKNQQSRVIEFDDVTYIKPQDHDKLIEQLTTLTGLDIKKIDIESINFKKNIVVVRVYYL